MQITDPIADMLTRIRNANIRQARVPWMCPLPSMKQAIAQILLGRGLHQGLPARGGRHPGRHPYHAEISGNKEKVISGLRRVSKPGLRVYAGADELPQVLKGLGIAIVSTSKGVMTDKEARKLHVGGEVLAFVW